MVTAVDLDQLAEASAALSRLMNAPSALTSRRPEPVLNHPLAERFDGHLNAVHFSELLVRERRAEVAVPLAHDPERVLAQRFGQAPVAGTAALLGDELVHSTASICAAQTLHLAHAQPEGIRGLRLRGSAILDSPHPLHSIQLSSGHGQQRQGHAATDTSIPTFLFGTNPTFSFWAYTQCPIFTEYDNSAETLGSTNRDSSNRA
jgi:hypothetical protein